MAAQLRHWRQALLRISRPRRGDHQGTRKEGELSRESRFRRASAHRSNNCGVGGGFSRDPARHAGCPRPRQRRCAAGDPGRGDPALHHLATPAWATQPSELLHFGPPSNPRQGRSWSRAPPRRLSRTVTPTHLARLSHPLHWLTPAGLARGLFQVWPAPQV